MLALALDTSNSFCSVCVIDSQKDQILGSINEEIGKGHAERLIGAIDFVLEQANVSYNDLDRIITSTGPGSFTGARVCVAAARGFSLTLKVPAIGVSNFEAYTRFFHKNSSDNLVVLLNAGRGQMFGQFSYTTEFSDAYVPFVADIEQLKLSTALQQDKLCLAGSDAAQIQESLETNLPLVELSNFSLIEEIAEIGVEKPVNSAHPEPLYLRASDAKPQHGFSIERIGK